MIVLDASAALEFLLGGRPAAGWVAARLLSAGGRVHAPHLIDIEIASGLRRRVLRGETPAERASAALASFAALRVARYPHVQLLDRIWELRDNLTVADAAYIALAEALDAPLVTTDVALAKVPGHGARVEAFPEAT